MFTLSSHYMWSLFIGKSRWNILINIFFKVTLKRVTLWPTCCWTHERDRLLSLLVQVLLLSEARLTTSCHTNYKSRLYKVLSRWKIPSLKWDNIMPHIHGMFEAMIWTHYLQGWPLLEQCLSLCLVCFSASLVDIFLIFLSSVLQFAFLISSPLSLVLVSYQDSSYGINMNRTTHITSVSDSNGLLYISIWIIIDTISTLSGQKRNHMWNHVARHVRDK